MRKITAFIPADVLQTAQSFTRQGVSETLRIALERLAHAEWCRQLQDLRGKVKLDVDLADLREDREFGDHGRPL